MKQTKSTAQLFCLGNTVHESTDLSLEIDRQIRLMRGCLKRFGPELYDMTTALLSLNV